MECTGAFRGKESCQFHLDNGAKKVLISAPGEKDVDATIVYGVNHSQIKKEHTVISNASCTTNGLAPIVKVIQEGIGIHYGLMNTIHSYTNDQVILDNMHNDVRRARSAAVSMIPTKTGAAVAIADVIPELAGKLDGMAVRVPTIDVSLVDLVFNAGRETSVEEVNQVLKTAAEGELGKVLSYCDQPLVSADFNHIAYSSNFDSLQTRVNGSMVKVMAWYDNEWGFSNRMLDNSLVLLNAE
jgi:glyceraldehyde 3-phosphate dehydrogenase